VEQEAATLDTKQNSLFISGFVPLFVCFGIPKALIRSKAQCLSIYVVCGGGDRGGHALTIDILILMSHTITGTELWL